MSFFPKVNANPTGWGPVGDLENIIIPSIPFTPFSRSERLGKAADWTTNTKYTTERALTRQAGVVSTAFNVFEEEDDADYSLVDTRFQKKPYNPGTGIRKYNKTQLQQKGKMVGGATGRGRGGGATGGQNWQAKGRPVAKTKKGQKYYQNQQWPGYGVRTGRRFLPSADVPPHWGDPVLIIEFPTIINSSSPTPLSDAENLYTCGRVERYNGEVYDKLILRHEKPLEKTERKRYQVTTKDDPIIKQLADNGAGNVYITDSILAVLMCVLKSVYSWDILVDKKDDNLFFDHKDDGFDFLTVNENSSELPDEDPNLPSNLVDELHKEATFLNFSFSQQLLYRDNDKAYKFPKPNPFQSSTDNAVASVAYFYRKWDLGDNIQMVARTEVDGFRYDKSDKPLFLVIKALNEYDTKITGNWKTKLESQKAACFATEVKSNNNKLSKWAVQAILAGAHELKLGYVTRQNPKDQYNHLILNVTTTTPNDFAKDIGVDIAKLLGYFKFLVMELKKLDDGKYIIMREGNKKQLVIYKTD